MKEFIESIDISQLTETVLPKVMTTVIIFAAALICVRIANSLLSRWQQRLLNRVQKRDPSNYSAVSTRFMIIKRTIIIGIYFFAFILFFLQFEALRNLGAGLLASAGVAGIVIGMAAQSTLSDMLAGISISFSQPVRLGDSVIIEKEYGIIEEIALMHIIVKTWDNRRIIIPNSSFSTKVVQNWSMKDPSLLGIVMLYVDYTCDLDQIRKWVSEIVDASEYSIKGKDKVAGVQIVDFTDRCMVLRILAKGPDAPNTWNLRCEIREKLIRKFREAELPLPRIRIETPHSIKEE